LALKVFSLSAKKVFYRYNGILTEMPVYLKCWFNRKAGLTETLV